MAMYGTILAIMTSMGLTGIASRFSIVPRSRSRVIDRVVMINVENVRTMQTSPGTMLRTVSCSGLYRACTTNWNGGFAGSDCNFGGRSRLSVAVRDPSAAVALLMAEGSVASASTRIDG